MVYMSMMHALTVSIPARTGSASSQTAKPCAAAATLIVTWSHTAAPTLTIRSSSASLTSPSGAMPAIATSFLPSSITLRPSTCRNSPKMHHLRTSCNKLKRLSTKTRSVRKTRTRTKLKKRRKRKLRRMSRTSSHSTSWLLLLMASVPHSPSSHTRTWSMASRMERTRISWYLQELACLSVLVSPTSAHPAPEFTTIWRSTICRSPNVSLLSTTSSTSQSPSTNFRSTLT